MSSLVFAAPYVPPPPPVELFTGITSRWAGWDGSDWDLNDPDRGIVLLPDVLGWHFAPTTDFVSESPAQHGQRFRGGRVLPRATEWNILLFSDSSGSWADLDRAFWSSLHPFEYGRWTVGVGNQHRWIDLRFKPSEYSYTWDPMFNGWAAYPVPGIADRPLWTASEPIRRGPWVRSVPAPFIPSTGGPPFTIAPTQSLEGATIENPGDVKGYVTWTIEAVTENVTLAITIDGTSFTTPTVPEGKTLVVDTDPAKGTAWLGTTVGEGDDRTFIAETEVSGQLSPTWRAVPPRREVAIGFAMTGYGIVSAELTPQFFRVL